LLTQSLELTHAFKIYDADKNGTMDAKEFKQVLKDLGKRDVTDEQVTGLLAEVDKNGDSVINWNEFLEVGSSNSVNDWCRCSSN
jgi:Ca2+-binding EF-hand superfamily protein